MSPGIALQNPKARSRLTVDRGGAQRHVGAALNVCSQEVSVIHAVELIAAQDEVVLVRALKKVGKVLAHGVSRALIPAGALARLPGGQDFDKAFSKDVKFVGARNVPVQGFGVKLRQNVDLAKPAVDAVADRDVHQTVFGT